MVNDFDFFFEAVVRAVDEALEERVPRTGVPVLAALAHLQGLIMSQFGPEEKDIAVESICEILRMTMDSPNVRRFAAKANGLH